MTHVYTVWSQYAGHRFEAAIESVWSTEELAKKEVERLYSGHQYKKACGDRVWVQKVTIDATDMHEGQY